jgi:hypothetical protein
MFLDYCIIPAVGQDRSAPASPDKASLVSERASEAMGRRATPHLAIHLGELLNNPTILSEIFSIPTTLSGLYSSHCGCCNSVSWREMIGLYGLSLLAIGK